jgi:hypothetical protein
MDTFIHSLKVGVCQCQCLLLYIANKIFCSPQFILAMSYKSMAQATSDQQLAFVLLAATATATAKMTVTAGDVGGGGGGTAIAATAMAMAVMVAGS